MPFTNIHDNLQFNAERCKQCGLCVAFCPLKSLKLEGKQVTSNGKCTKCGMCERYCPDLAIQII